MTTKMEYADYLTRLSRNSQKSAQDFNKENTDGMYRAVHDIQEGKGRCDLLPLDVIAHWLDGNVFGCINSFKEGGDKRCLYQALDCFNGFNGNKPAMALEVSKHFEAGALKYGENNWQKGIPTHCYIDSAVRHYLKWLRGDKDEPHDRAFVWNLLCCIWTCEHKPELNDYKKEGK